MKKLYEKLECNMKPVCTFSIYPSRKLCILLNTILLTFTSVFCRTLCTNNHIYNFCRMTHFSFLSQNWYCLSKTEAESEAWEFSRKTGLGLVAICPTVVLGLILQSNVNASTLILLKLLKGIT